MTVITICNVSLIQHPLEQDICDIFLEGCFYNRPKILVYLIGLLECILSVSPWIPATVLAVGVGICNNLEAMDRILYAGFIMIMFEFFAYLLYGRFF